MAGPGPVGYIFHKASEKPIHPLNGSYDPPNGTDIVVYNDLKGPGRLQFRHVPKNGEWGYIEQVSSGKIVYPKNGSAGDGTHLTLESSDGKGSEAHFKIDQTKKEIEHFGSGKIWHPLGGSTNPSDNTSIVLHGDRHDGAKFYFGDRSGKLLNVIREK